MRQWAEKQPEERAVTADQLLAANSHDMANKDDVAWLMERLQPQASI